MILAALVIATATFAPTATVETPAPTSSLDVPVPVPVNPPTAPTAAAAKEREPTLKERRHAAAVVGITGAGVNIVAYSALMGAAFLTAGYVGAGALLIPIVGVPIVLGMAVYIASTFVTDAAGALANTGGALLGHYIGVFLGLVSGVGAGLAYQGATKSGDAGADFNVNLLTFGGVGAMVGAALGGTVGAAVGGGAVAAFTVGDE